MIAAPGSAEGGPRLTDEQAGALGVAGASVALGAGAGCGKTTVLTERFLRALGSGGDDRNPLATIVALTFTVKAARELRQRIRAACHERMSAVPRDQAGFWRTVLRGLEAAPISTFHEYCTGLLRRHALAAGIDPDFEVLDESLTAALRAETLTRQIRRWLAEQNDDLIAAAAIFGLGPIRDILDRLVADRNADQLADWAELTPHQLAARWEEAWTRLCRDRLVDAVDAAGRDCLDWIDTQAFEHPKIRPWCARMLAALPELIERIEDRGWVAELRETAKMPYHTYFPSPDAKDATKERLQALRDAIDCWWKQSTRDEGATLVGADLGVRLARLAAKARAAYAEAKAVRGGLDFDDLILRTRDLLERDPGLVRDDAQRPIEFVLVDEFQDTDPAQGQILRALTGPRFDDGGLFIVGDFKQSIYRFRGARPALFREYREAFPSDGRRELTANFRSCLGVIDFVNALFQKAFPPEEPRLRGGFEAAAGDDRPAVEFVWPVDEEAVEAGEKLNSAALRVVEARWLARILRARLDAGWLIRDRGAPGGAARPAHAGDVAFLFRAMTDVAPYEKALVAEGFDVHIVGGAAFYAQQEIQDVVNVLSAIDDPFDAVSLAGALRSPLFGLSDAVLFHLGAPGPDGLAGRFASEAVPPGLPADDRARLTRARALLARWRGRKDRVASAELIEGILDESGYEAALAGEYLGDRKRANARKLVRIARRFDARPGFTLSQVVARFREDLLEPPREGEAATTDEEGTSVRLMSIHQSKGLEFPIVVLPDLNRKSDAQRGNVALDPELGPLVRISASADDSEESSGSGVSRGWAVYRAVEQEEASAESLRLFYVATTRARDALILSAGGGPATKPASDALTLLDDRFDRATGLCTAELPDDWPAPRVGVIAACPGSDAPSGASAGRRLSPGRLAQLIESAPDFNVARRPTRSTAPAWPRYVDLDDLSRLPDGEGRLARLIRALLAESELKTSDGLPTLAGRVGRRQVPRATASLVDEAVARLAPWLDGPLGSRLVRASKVARNVRWSMTWPEGSRPDAATVIAGWSDLLVCDAQGVWSVGVVSPPGASSAYERLRWLGAIQAANARGDLGPLGPCWRLDLDDDGGFSVIDRPEPAQLDEALDALLAAEV